MATPSSSVLYAGEDSISYVAIPVGTSGNQLRIKLKHPTLEAYWKTIGYDNANFYDSFNRVIEKDGTYTLIARLTFENDLLTSGRDAQTTLRIKQAAPAPVVSEIIIDGTNAGVNEVDVFIFP